MGKAKWRGFTLASGVLALLSASARSSRRTPRGFHPCGHDVIVPLRVRVALTPKNERLAPGSRAHEPRLSHTTQERERAGAIRLGEEGPILLKLELLTLQAQGDWSGFATVSIRVLDGGRIQSDLLGMNREHARWPQVLALAQTELEARPLRLSKASERLELEIRIELRVQIAVSLFGIPLKKGRGVLPGTATRNGGVSSISSTPRTSPENAHGWFPLRSTVF